MRDLDAARKAYSDRDIEASALVHNGEDGHHEEKHSKVGEQIKSIVYGGLDGIITTFAIVSVAAILIMGFSNIFADGWNRLDFLIHSALSMGIGDALSSKAESDYIRMERKREKWSSFADPASSFDRECDNNIEGEIEEMIDLYCKRGMSKEDAETVIRIMARKPDFFIDVMMTEELGLIMPDEDDSPWKEGSGLIFRAQPAGAITFASFVFFGTFPLLGYVALSAKVSDVTTLFFVAIALTAVTLFALGVMKSKFSTSSWWVSGLEILIIGAMASASAYAIGFLVAKYVHINA